MIFVIAVSFYYLVNIYPTGDDGWYELMKLQGIESLSSSLRDRTLTSSILEAYQWIAGDPCYRLVLLHIVLWLSFSAETFLLCALIFPNRIESAYLAALFVLSPIIVKSGVVAITYDSATIVPAVVAYGGVLLCVLSVRKEGSSRPTAVLGFCFCFLAGLISEYGFCATLAGGTFLVVSSALDIFKKRTVGVFLGLGLLIVSATSYLCFSLFFSSLDPSSKKNVLSIKTDFTDVLSVAVSWLSHVYYINFGTTFRELGNLEYQFDSRSTLLALVSGCTVCALMWLCSSSKGNAPAAKPRRLYAAITLATAVSIFPFMLTGRNAFSHYLNTRYFIVALPFAAVGILVFSSLITSRTTFKIAFLILAFLIGSVPVTFLSGVLRHEQKLEALGRSLQPFSSEDGIIVFVIGREENSAISLSGKLTQSWPASARTNTWIMPEADALDIFGKRPDCTMPDRFALDHRGLRRNGVLQAIYFVDQTANGQLVMEKYCKPSGPQG